MECRVLLGPAGGRRPNPDGAQRVRQQRARLPPDRRADRSRRGRRPRRRKRTDRPRRACRSRRRAHEADRVDVGADGGRPREPRRRGRSHRTRRRHPVSARRHPGGRAVPHRRRRARVRHADGHRPQVPPRTAGHGLPLRGPARDRPTRTVRRRNPLRHLGRRSLVHLGRRRASVRDMGEQLRQRRRPRSGGAPGTRPRVGRNRHAL